jgi:hypothetical protein
MITIYPTSAKAISYVNFDVMLVIPIFTYLLNTS